MIAITPGLPAAEFLPDELGRQRRLIRADKPPGRCRLKKATPSIFLQIGNPHGKPTAPLGSRPGHFQSERARKGSVAIDGASPCQALTDIGLSGDRLAQAMLDSHAKLIASAAPRQNEVAVFVTERIKPDQGGVVVGRFEEALAIRIVQQAPWRHDHSNRLPRNGFFRPMPILFGCNARKRQPG
jgi:hypothetical protein